MPVWISLGMPSPLPNTRSTARPRGESFRCLVMASGADRQVRIFDLQVRGGRQDYRRLVPSPVRLILLQVLHASKLMSSDFQGKKMASAFASKEAIRALKTPAASESLT
jgi:hypothetical protein